MNRLLTIKHWQLFLLLFGIPITVEIIVMLGSVFGHYWMMLCFIPVILLYIGVFFSWFYAMGTNLNKKLPPTVKMNLRRFKVFMIFPYAYIFLIFIVGAAAASGVFNNIRNSGVSPLAIVLPAVILIIPLHLFSMFCIFYCLYFNATSLKAVELQREVTFNDYAGEFFLMWFFLIGVWFIQPRINKLFDETLQTTGQI